MTIKPFELERYFARYEFGVDYLLCSSDCESVEIGDLLAYEPDAAERFHAHWLGYTETRGAPSLREEIVKLYDTVGTEDLIVFSGAQEAIYLFAMATLSAGDHAIVHWPSYQSLFEVGHSQGAEMTLWKGDPAHGWALDVDELESLIRPNTKAILVNFPHNPTGYLMDHESYARVHQIAAEHGITVFCDEVYRESEHDVADRLTAGCDMGEHAVSLGVMSKTYGLAGLRIGWLASRNSELLEKIETLKDYTTICNSAPSEFLAELALRHRQKLVDRNLSLIEGNLALLDQFFAQHTDRFDWQRPIAGSIAFPKYLGGPVDQFTHELVTESGVLLLPGTIYADDHNCFRIGFGRANMPQAIERLEGFLSGR